MWTPDFFVPESPAPKPVGVWVGAGLASSQELAVTVGHLLPLRPCYLLTYTAPRHCKTRQATGKIKNTADLRTPEVSITKFKRLIFTPR